ncbi:MAG: hypothetical protein HY096_00815 [Nitrospinae bacterium]|nr:hypothetical protein [Nitrospinota bacterium]
MGIQKIKISDKDFLEQYINFNISHRCVICEVCLKSFDKGNWAVKKSIGIEIISQYIGMLEDTAMIYCSLKDKSKEKSFFKVLNDVFINEKDNYKYSSKEIYKELDELEKINFDVFLKKINLPTRVEILKLADSSLIDELGGSEQAKKQYEKETAGILKNIKEMIGNRFKTRDGKSLNLVKFYNKIKHGSIFVNDKTNEESIYFPVKVKNLDREGKEVLMEAYNLICSKKASLEKLVNQMKILSDDLINLLGNFFRYNYKT